MEMKIKENREKLNETSAKMIGMQFTAGVLKYYCKLIYFEYA